MLKGLWFDGTIGGLEFYAEWNYISTGWSFDRERRELRIGKLVVQFAQIKKQGEKEWVGPETLLE